MFLKQLKLIVFNQGIKSILKKLELLLIVLFMAVYTWTAYRYGNFNIFALPHRIIIQGYRFDIDNDVVTLTGYQKPLNEVSGIMDKLTGKRIYSVEKNFKADYGIRLQCGGGA